MTTTPASREDTLRVGLTGGIASGKSTVADMFAALGAAIIDTDIIAREVVAPGEPALDEIRDAFGDEYIAADGTLDRARMRRLVFADGRARETLESILHPRIRDATLEQARDQDGAYQLIVVPLLVGSPLVEFVDRVLVVDCDEDTQVARLLARDAETEQQARRILATQSSREERLAVADDVIRNDGSIAETARQVEALDRYYRELVRDRQ